MLRILAIAIIVKCTQAEFLYYGHYGHHGQLVTVKEPITDPPLPMECEQKQIHPQQHFCDVSRAVVKAKIIRRMEIVVSDYEIQILKVFKGPAALITQTIITNNRLCPADLTPDNDTYIITGIVDDDGTNFRTSQGNWIQKVDTLSVIQKIGLRSYYNEACGKCEIKSCSGADCSVIDKDACKMDVGWSESITNCYTRNSVCRRRIRCVWRSWNITKDENGRHFNRRNCN